MVEVQERPCAAAREAIPPSANHLIQEGLVATNDDPDRFFAGSERSIAGWLRAKGVRELRSVRERSVENEPTPDSVFDQFGVTNTLEMKALDQPTEGALSGAIRRGRRQSPIVVVDGRSVQISRGVAEAGLRRAVRSYGNDLRQVLVVLDDEAVIGWKA